MKRINTKLKRYWGISEIGFSFMATMETSFFIIFLTDVARLPLAMVGVITGLSGIADAVTAVLAGAVIDKTNFKNGKYRPWLVYCPPIVVIFFILMFTKIGSDMTAAILCSVGYIVSHGVWNIAWTANRAIVGELSDVPEERAFLSGRIAAGASGGKILGSYLVPVLTAAFLGLFTGMGETWGYTATALVASLVFTLTYFIHYQITKGYDIPEEQGKSGKKTVSLPDMLKAIVQNPQLLVLLLADAMRLIAFYMIAACAGYYTKIVLENPSAVSILLVLFNAGTLVGSLMAKQIVAKLGTKLSTILGTGGLAVILVLLYFLPANQAIVFIILFVAQLIFGAAYGLTTSMYSMCGTYGEYKTGKDIKGVIMACSSLAIKIAVALRGVIISAVLAAIAYVPDGPVTATAQGGIKLLFFIVPALFCILSVVLFFFYKIKDSEIAGMEQEIAERKKVSRRR